MIHFIRLFTSKYFPGKYNEVLHIYLGIRKIISGFNVIHDALCGIFFKSQMTFFPSDGMTTSSVFRENALLFLSKTEMIANDIYYFGEVERGKMLFGLFINDSVALEQTLFSIISSGGNIIFQDNNGSNKLVNGRQIWWRKKISRHITTSKKIYVFNAYRNNNKIVEFSSLYSVEVDIWRHHKNEVYKTNSTNNIQNLIDIDRVETEELVIFGYTVKQFIEVKNYNTYLRDSRLKKIDIVYAWVDGSDQLWCNKKQQYLNDTIQGKVNDSAFGYSRYASRDELKYSLRSVYKYLDYINKIYIVTDGQRPDWLSESSDICIIDHRDIFPDTTVLPVFNSHAIETCFHRIKGLSEHYLYLNDDIIFGRYVPLNLFFPKIGKINIFPSNQTFIHFGNVSKMDLPVDSAAKNTRALFQKKTGLVYPVNKFKHTPIPQLKSMMFELEDLFKAEIEETRRSRFRQPTDISMASSLFYHYALSKECASRSNIRYTYIQLGDNKYHQEMLRLLADNDAVKFDVFCVNDQLLDSKHEKEITSNFHKVMKQLYPKKGAFEI